MSPPRSLGSPPRSLGGAVAHPRDIMAAAPVLLALLALSLLSVVRAGQIMVSVESLADDSEEDVRDGSMYMDSSDLELMNDGNEQVVGIRFPSVPLPPMAHVTEAHIPFDTDEIRPGQTDAPVTIAIHGEASVASAALSDSAHDLSSRSPTRSAVTWTPESSANEHDELFTPDIKSIVSEIISLPGWRSGSPLAVLMTQVSGDGVRWVESHRQNNGIDTPVRKARPRCCSACVSKPCCAQALVVTFDGEAGAGGNGFQVVAAVTGREDDSEESVQDGSMYGPLL